MRLAPVILLILAALALSGCSIADHSTAYVRHKEVIVGNDTDFEVTADNLTRGEIPAGQGGVTIIMNPKGTKVLKTVYHDPLAGIITASGVHVIVGRNQSNAFGKLIGAANNLIMGWVTNTGVQALTQQKASDNAARTASEKIAAGAAATKGEQEIAKELAGKVPAEEAAGALGSAIGQ